MTCLLQTFFWIYKKCRETKLSDKAVARGAFFILSIQ